ncbi:MAG: hypothetical protein ACI84C_002854 [Flavobacteriales bacterium]|jgi:hypothetical protein
MNFGRKPDIICIGAQKAGTSWLHVTLSKRPDIWVPPFKELHFFDYKFIEECRRWAPWHVKKGLKQELERHSNLSPPDHDYIEYLNKLKKAPILNGTWYKFVFSRARIGQICLDTTPEYSCLPSEGVDFFKRFLPKAKIIYIIRHPFDRLKSQIRMNASRGEAAASSREDWMGLLEMQALRTRGDYINNIPRWDQRFEDNQLLYVPFGWIEKQPQKLLRMIEGHCNLPPYEYDRLETKIHKTVPMNLPEFVLERLEEMALPQKKFLEERFDRDFLEQSI